MALGEEEFLAAAMAMRSKLYHAAMAILWNEQDAADAVQEAMLKGWKRRGSLRDEGLFEAWFMRILVNQCRDAQRKLIRGRRLLQDAGRRQQLDQAPAPDLGLLEAIHRLPEKYRLPVLLYYFDGYSQKEIGRIVGATGEQVKSRIRTGRDRLRALLDGDEARWERGGDGRE